MTGFGEGQASADGVTASVEVRSVNNRYLKVSVRGTDPYPLMESEFEKAVKKAIRRGSVQVQVRVERPGGSGRCRIDAAVVRGYVEQFTQICYEANRLELLPSLVQGVPGLPGVLAETAGRADAGEGEWPLVEQALEAALAKMLAFRQTEGRAMADELLAHRRALSACVEQVKALQPGVTEAFRQRLHERIRAALSAADVPVSMPDLIREVAVFAERSDVAEETARLGAHLEQFEAIVERETDAPGRKLEFVAQEMFRETNTIGSKAGDVSISRLVVEMKATLEKVRELVQNVE